MTGWALALLAVRPLDPAATRVLDKEALYGDPALVPTRAGERAREELAIAAAVAAAVRAHGGGAPVVEVRLPAGADGGAVVVAGELALAPDDVVRVAEEVAPAWSVGRVRVFARAAAPGVSEAACSPDRTGPRWPLGLALVGFGASAGIAVDRLRRRRRSR